MRKRRCRHKDVTGCAWSAAYPRWYASYKAHARDAKSDALICNDCGDWLPLGPSNDSSEAVKLEIRAAEIADYLADASALCDWTLSNEAFIGATAFEERRGWALSDPSVRMYSPAWHAGYLARVIVTHEEP